jgi:uncharacterized protein (TIGR00725 family)
MNSFRGYNIGVIGGSVIDGEYCRIAEDLGRKLAVRGHLVICGGLGGVMECVARGVSEEKGVSIGILPGASPDSGNPYIGISIPTGIGYMRNFFIIRASDALISIDGSTGTMSEAAFALSEGKSVISIGDPVVSTKKPTDGKIIVVSTPEEAVIAAEQEAEIQREKSRKTDMLMGYHH